LPEGRVAGAGPLPIASVSARSSTAGDRPAVW
jgi:hypothetical protein